MRKLVASVLILAIVASAFQVGRAAAGSHKGAMPVAIVYPGPFVLDDSGRLFQKNNDGLGWTQFAQCPPGVPATMTQWPSDGSGFKFLVAMQNGDVFIGPHANPTLEWAFLGNVFNDPAVGTSSSTIGDLKHRYR